jgi:hypothetical protein
MSQISKPDINASLLDSVGKPVQRFRTWINEVTRLGIIRGTGSPEGVVEALEDQQYYDDSGGPGANMYIKKLDNIAGDKSKGWELT